MSGLLALARLRRESDDALREIFMKAPAAIAALRGPQHVFQVANPTYLQLVGNRDVIGKPVREALPEIEGQGFLDLLDQVYTSPVGRLPVLPPQADRRRAPAPRDREACARQGGVSLLLVPEQASQHRLAEAAEIVGDLAVVVRVEDAAQVEAAGGG